MDSLEEFKNKIKRVKEHRHYKIKGTFDIQKCFTYYRQHRPKSKEFVITESQFYKIINAVHEEFIKIMLTGTDVILPHSMGVLRISKKFPGVSYQDGELKNTYPINWNKTIELWYSDVEAYKNKTLVYETLKVKYKPTYMKKDATYKNRYYFTIRFTRDLIKRMSKYITEHPEFDCATF